MEFSINRHALLESLNKANKIVDFKIINPALTGVLLEVSSEQLTLISTNNSLSFKTTLDFKNSGLEVKEPGRILLRGKYVIEMLRRLDQDLVNFINIENQQLTIKTDNIEFNCSLLAAEDYPLLGFQSLGSEIVLDPIVLKKTLSQTMVAVDETHVKMILTGLNFRVKDQFLLVSATDMHRISQKGIPLTDAENLNLNVTVPYRTVLELSRFLDNVKNLRIIFTGGHITFLMDNMVFQSTLIEGQFPLVEAVFPKDFSFTLHVNSKSFLKALNRADLSNESSTPPIINLNIQSSRIMMKADLNEIGNFEEEFYDFESDIHENLDINFNLKYLIEALRTFNDFLEMKFVSSTKPLLMKQKDDDNLKQIILPTYISN